MIKVHILTYCDAPGCVALHTLETEWQRDGRRVPEPTLPDGWQQVGNKTFCERHKIVVALTVDGQPVDAA
jgi:hypothetical protein